MAGERDHEEGGEDGAQEDRDRPCDRGGRRDESEQDGHGRGAHHGVVGDQRAAGEGEDEREEVEGERDDPEERRRRDVVGEERGGREREAGRDERERHPAEDASLRGGRLIRRGLHRRSDRRIAHREDQGGHEDGEEAVEPGPRGGLRSEGQLRLDDQGIGDEAEEAAEVARGVEEVGVGRPRVARGREPPLEQRAARREGEEGRAHRDQHGEEQPGDGGRVDGRRGRAGEAEREREEG